MDLRRIGLVTAGLAAAAVLFVVLRPAGEEDDDAAPATTAPATTEADPGTTTAPAPPPPAPPPEVPVVRIEIRGGEIVGGLRTITIKRGRTVRLVVTSDVADHVHVHGIDVFQDVAPGRPARFTLTPEVAGRYEIELEDRHFQIAQLTVTP